jgi:hypothetical protein
VLVSDYPCATSPASMCGTTGCRGIGLGITVLDKYLTLGSENHCVHESPEALVGMLLLTEEATSLINYKWCCVALLQILLGQYEYQQLQYPTQLCSSGSISIKSSLIPWRTLNKIHSVVS